MKITKDLLTAEHGFEDGVVVELRWDENSRQVSIFQADELGLIADCYSFKPLTGPKAIWNSAPAGMDILIKTKSEGSTVFDCFYFMAALPDKFGQDDVIVYRPWWASSIK